MKFYNDKGLVHDSKCLLLTNDRLNAEAANKEGIDSASVRQYVEHVIPELMDKVAGANEEGVEIDRNINYPGHLSLSQIQIRIKSGKLVQGKLEISRDNYLEGIIRLGERDILIQGRNDLNRGMNEDIVAVRIKDRVRNLCVI